MSGSKPEQSAWPGNGPARSQAKQIISTAKNAKRRLTSHQNETKSPGMVAGPVDGATGKLS